MKKLLLTWSLLVFAFITASAQKQYVYLKKQTSPFNGEFNEPCIKGVDSISYIYYENEQYVDYIIDEKRPPYEEIPRFFPASVDYFLIKNSSDGLSDTLRYYEESDGETAKFVKKYSNDGELVYSSSTLPLPGYTDIEERKFVYDAEGRISEISTVRNHDGAATVMVYDTIQYDYEFKAYLESATLEYNTIYKKNSRGINDSILVFYLDDQNCYETIEFFRSPDATLKQYFFDNQNRLVKIISSCMEAGPLSGDEVKCAEYTIEYKYTDKGYEEYQNEIKTTEYKFQNDGYCTEVIYYTPMDATVFPPVYDVVAIEKFSYCKDGSPIVTNELTDSFVPKIYGIQGGIVVLTEKSLPVHIYSFSGSLMKKVKVGEGNHTIAMSKGLYIATVGNMSYKILVR